MPDYDTRNKDGKDGFQSMEECKKSIKVLADAIDNSSDSTFVNSSRILLMRILLDLFEEYNEMLKFIENRNGEIK